MTSSVVIIFKMVVKSSRDFGNFTRTKWIIFNTMLLALTHKYKFTAEELRTRIKKVIKLQGSADKDAEGLLRMIFS